MLWNYYQSVGKFLDVVETEKEILMEVPGMDIPILGYVDVTTKTEIIDVKTTGYFRKSPELNPEWKLQMNIYQMENPTVGEFHILTRNKTTPVVIPQNDADPLRVFPPTLTQRLTLWARSTKKWSGSTKPSERKQIGAETEPTPGPTSIALSERNAATGSRNSLGCWVV